MRSRLALTLVTAMALVALMTPAIGLGARAQDEIATPAAATPGEIVLDGARYAFDRTVPVDLAQLEQRTDASGNPVWVRPGGGPLGAVYAQGAGGAARYLPEYLDAPETACPSAVTADAGTIQAGDVTYVPAGPEPDLSPDTLAQVGQASDGRTIYAPSTEQPFPELFATAPEGGLVHYIAIEPNGVPATFPERYRFAGQEFQLTAGEAGTIEGMQQVGCAMAFPALADAAEAGGPLSALTLQVGDQLVVYRAVGPQPEAPPVTEAPVIVPTEVPTAAPTVAPTEIPTVAPTATTSPVPTTAPTVAPIATPTPEPTATSTPAPTMQPTTAATTAPTTAPTMQPTTAATAAPTVAPTATPTPRPTPTPEPLQPRAVVPTLPPSAPPPAAATFPAVGCTGDPGPIGANGLPERLPPALQYRGTGYRYVETVPVEEIGDLDRIGCVGAFEAYVDTADDALYLTLGAVSDTAWRYERTSSFEVTVEVTADPRVLVLQGQGDQPDVRYRATDPMVRSVYSSVSLILYVDDAENPTPDRILGFAVDQDLFGEYRPEGEAEPASEEVQARAEEHGIHPTLTVGGNPQTYVLVALWEPFGTTTNGWLTLYAPSGEEAPAQLVGRDPRKLELSVFERQGS